MASIKERIKELRKKYGYTQESLAETLGLSAKSSIANYESGANAPSDEIKLKMCNLFNCSMDYLMGITSYANSKEDLEKELYKFNLTENEYYDAVNCFMNDNIQGLGFLIYYGGLDETKEYKVLSTILHFVLDYTPDKTKLNDIGEQDFFEQQLRENMKYAKKMLLSLDKSKIIHNYNKEKSNVFPIPESVVKVPIVGKIAAGIPILAIENIVDYAFAPASQIKEGFEYFYLYVKGDSMNLKFNEGDLILIQQQDYLENKEIGVFLIEEEATVKQFREQKGNILILDPMSSNAINHTQMYDIKEISVKIIGKVISYQGKI